MFCHSNNNNNRNQNGSSPNVAFCGIGSRNTILPSSPSQNLNQQNHHTDETDAHLAKEMNELSVQEREKVLEEIHGVAKEQEETPELIQTSLTQLDKCLADIPKAKRKALDRAIFFKPSLLLSNKHDETDKHDDDGRRFKLMFLRADYFDASKASKKICKYFEEKLALFQDDFLLAKKITLEDLSKNDINMIDKKGCLLLPQKDSAGRPIFFIDMTKFDFSDQNGEFTGTPTNHLRALWYQVMAALEDEAAQIKGVFSITCCPGNLLTLPVVTKYPDFLKRCGELFEILPLRISSYHFCYDDPNMKFLLSTIQMAFGKHVRLRQRAHFGSDIEIEYSLMTFGVPCGILFQDDGIAKQEILESFKRHHADLERRENERRLQQEEETGIISWPNPKDVLIGRGRPYQDFAGNRRLGYMIDANLKKYRECSRFEKTCVTMDLVKTVLAYGGRFIERTETGWKRIEEGAAREKISSGFRTKFPKLSNNANNTNAATIPPVLTQSTHNNDYKYPHLGVVRQGGPAVFEKNSNNNTAAKRLRYTATTATTTTQQQQYHESSMLFVR